MSQVGAVRHKTLWVGPASGSKSGFFPAILVIASLAVSPDGKWVAAGDTEGRLTIWNLADQTEIVSKDIYKNDVTHIAISPDSRQLATISFDKDVSIWIADALEPIHRFEVTDNGLKRVEFITSNVLAVAGEKIRSWNTDTGTLVQELSPGRYNYMLARSPDNKWFVFGVEDGLHFWSVDESKVTTQARVDFGSNCLLEFSPDGKYLATASDAMIRIWNLASQQFVQAIDVLGPATSGLRWMPNANMMVIVSEKAPTDQQEAEQFYRYFLVRDGWAELPPTQSSSPRSIEFVKNGFRIISRFSPEGNSATSVDLTHMGNFDLRWVPRIDAGPVNDTFESSATVLYKVKADLVQIETALLRKMHEAGWTAYSRLNSSHREETDSRGMEFLRNSTILQVSVQKSLDDPSTYHVQYSGFWTLHALPIPRDSGFVEFDGSSAPYLVATTAMNLEQTREYYDSEMNAQGWLQSARGRTIKDDYHWLTYMRGQQDVPTLSIVR